MGSGTRDFGGAAAIDVEVSANDRPRIPCNFGSTGNRCLTRAHGGGRTNHDAIGTYGNRVPCG